MLDRGGAEMGRRCSVGTEFRSEVLVGKQQQQQKTKPETLLRRKVLLLPGDEDGSRDGRVLVVRA